MPPPQNVGHLHHPSAVHHPDPSKPMFDYKAEHPSSFVDPSGPDLKPGYGEAVPGDFRPNRSRPSFSDNASLELLYSLFRSLTRTTGQPVDQEPGHAVAPAPV